MPCGTVLQWRDFRQAHASLAKIGVVIELIWVPSHGKHLDWRPPPHLGGTLLRDLNDIADIHATRGLRMADALSGASDWLETVEESRQWAEKVLNFAVSIAPVFEAHVATVIAGKQRVAAEYFNGAFRGSGRCTTTRHTAAHFVDQ